MEEPGTQVTQRSRMAYAILLLSFVLYTVGWSYIVLLRYNSYHAGIFDLGLASSYLYSFAHGGFSYLISNPASVPYNKLIVLVLSVPYALWANPSWLVVFQSFWIGLGVFPLYMIVRKYIASSLYASVFSITYLIYYPLSGVNWFDFHFMAVFPTAFLFSVMFNLYGRKKYASVFGILAIISDYLVPLIFIFYSVYSIADRKRRSGELKIEPFEMIMLGTSLLILLLVNVFFGFAFTTQYLHLSGATYNTAYVAGMQQKLTYVYAMLLPLLFLSVLGIDFLAVGIPFFALGFVNSYEPYVTTMYFQYPALIAPIIFISAAMGLSRLVYRKKRENLKVLKTVSITVLLFNVILFSFFSPIGNLFTSSIYNGDYGKYISGNSYQYYSLNSITVKQYDSYLSEISGQIPSGSSILIQNNMPQLTAGYNWSMPDFRNPGFQPQYALIDPHSMFYNNYSAAYHRENTTMMDMANTYFQSGNYSIEYSMDGIVLLNHTGSETIRSFVPVQFDTSINYTSGGIYGNGQTYYAGTIPFLIPGLYSVKITDVNGTTYVNGQIHFSVFQLDNGMLIPVSLHLSGTHLSFSVTNFTDSVVLVFKNIQPNSPLALNLEILQLPP